MTTQFASDLSSGCTPCECGVPGACTKEQLPSFLQWIPTDALFVLLATLLPFIAVLAIAILSHNLLKRVWQTANNTVLRTISVLIGAFFVPPIANWITTLNLVDTETPSNRLFICCAIGIIAAYVVLSFIDIKRKKTAPIGSAVGMSVVLGLVLVVGYSYNSAVDSKQKHLENQIQEIVNSQNESGQSVLESLGITQKASDAVMALKTKKYIDLGNQMGTNQKFVLYFRDYDGAHFTKQEFQNIAAGNKFKEVEVYHNAADFIVTADQLLGYITELLGDNYKTDYYLDNRRVSDDTKDSNSYSEASVTYTSGNKYATITYIKSNEGSWYLSKIGYYDPALQGY